MISGKSWRHVSVILHPQWCLLDIQLYNYMILYYPSLKEDIVLLLYIVLVIFTSTIYSRANLWHIFRLPQKDRTMRFSPVDLMSVFPWNGKTLFMWIGLSTTSFDLVWMVPVIHQHWYTNPSLLAVHSCSLHLMLWTASREREFHFLSKDRLHLSKERD